MEVNVNQDTIQEMRRTHRNKKRKKIIRLVTALVVIILVIALIVIIKTVKKDNAVTEEERQKQQVVETLVGKWTTDGNTIYEFVDESKGNLIVPLMTLPFTYKLENNTIFIDFENESSDDMTYTYTLDSDKLLLNGEYGTFNFSRVEE